MLRDYGIAVVNVALPGIKRTVFSALLVTLYSSSNAVPADIYEYKDKEGRRIFTNVCDEERLKSGCKKVALKERPPLSPEDEVRLRTSFPGSKLIDEFIKEARQRSNISTRQPALRADTNGDGKVTIGDAPGWVEWAFYYPGNWVVDIVSHRYKKFAGFLELRQMNYGGMVSLLLSGAAWSLLVVLCIGLKRATKRIRANRYHQSLVSKVTCR